MGGVETAHLACNNLQTQRLTLCCQVCPARRRFWRRDACGRPVLHGSTQQRFTCLPKWQVGLDVRQSQRSLIHTAHWKRQRTHGTTGVSLGAVSVRCATPLRQARTRTATPGCFASRGSTAARTTPSPEGHAPAVESSAPQAMRRHWPGVVCSGTLMCTERTTREAAAAVAAPFAALAARPCGSS